MHHSYLLRLCGNLEVKSDLLKRTMASVLALGSYLPAGSCPAGHYRRLSPEPPLL